MKYLEWIRKHLNVISFVSGVGFLLLGKEEVGLILINGAPL